MKLKTKLIPLVSAASVSAVAIPLATTSCGLTRYTDMLAEYVPGVTPYTKTTITGIANANEVYRDRFVLNNDIVRDDILYTYSQCLTTKESRDRINYIAQFTTYDLDIGVDGVKDEQGREYVRITYYAHVTGKAAHAEVGSYANITNFDFDIQCSFSNIGAATFYEDETTHEATKGAVALKDYYVMAIPGWAGVIVDASATGSLSYIDEDAEKEIDIPDFNEHAIFTPAEGLDVKDYLAFYPFWEFVAAVPYIGLVDEAFVLDNVTSLLFASHYFKDVTIEVPENP